MEVCARGVPDLPRELYSGRGNEARGLRHISESLTLALSGFFLSPSRRRPKCFIGKSPLRVPERKHFS